MRFNRFRKFILVNVLIFGIFLGLLPSTASAQFAPPTAPPPGGQPVTSGGIGGGTTGRLPYWATSSTLGSSNLEWNSASNSLRIRGANSGYVDLKAPADSSGSSFTLPGVDGAAGQVLATDGAGTLTWADGGIGSGSAGYGGTGADGVCCSVNTTLTANAQHPDGIYNFSTFSVPAGITVTIDNGLNPIRIYSKNNVVIDGILTAKGKGANGGAGGYFGYSTPVPPTAGQQGVNSLYYGGAAGSNQTWWVHGPDATCPYGLCVTSEPGTPGGSGAGAAAGGGAGSPPSGSGALYVPLVPGAGGGGGGTSYSSAGAYSSGGNPYTAIGNGPGGNGGKGGGSVMIETPGSITVGNSGSVTAQGDDATIGAISYTTFWATQYCGGLPIYPIYVQQASAGGGGGGGTVYLRASDLINRSTTYATGKSFVEEAGISAKGGTGGNQLPRGTGSCSTYYQYGGVLLTTPYSAFGPSGGNGVVFYEKIDAKAGPSILSGGQADKLAVWADAGNLYNDYNLHWDNINKRLGVGNASPQTALDVTGTTRTSNLQLTNGTSGTPGEGKILVSDANGNARWVSNPWTIGTTTQNYVAKFGNGTQVTNSQIFDNGTSIGIGTTTPDPTKKLDIVGDVQISKLNVTQDFTVSGEPILTGGGGAGSLAEFRFSRTTLPTSYYYGYYYINTTIDRDGVCASDLGANYKAATLLDAQVYGGGSTSGISFATYDSGNSSYKYTGSVNTYWGAPYYVYGAAAYSGTTLTSNSPYSTSAVPVACIHKAAKFRFSRTTLPTSYYYGYYYINTTIDRDGVCASDFGANYKAATLLDAQVYGGGSTSGLSFATYDSSNGSYKYSGSVNTYWGAPYYNYGAAAYSGTTLTSNSPYSTSAVPVACISRGGSATSDVLNGTGTAGKVVYWQNETDLNQDNVFAWDSVNKRLGVGTATPSTTLDVNGQIKISGGGPGAGKFLMSDASGLASWTNGVSGSGTTNYIAKWTSSGAQGNSLIFDNGTNVGVGNTSPSQKLDVSGNVNATGLCISGDCKTSWAAVGGGGGGSGSTAWIQFTRTSVNSYGTDSAKDAACTSELGSGYRAASLADVNANITGVAYISGSAYFNIAGSSYTYILSSTSNANYWSPYVYYGGTGTYPVACINMSAPIQFSRVGVNSYGTDSAKDAACTSELGSSFRAASLADVTANIVGTSYTSGSHYFNIASSYYTYILGSTSNTNYWSPYIYYGGTGTYSMACINIAGGGSGGGGGGTAKPGASVMTYYSNPGGTGISTCPSGWTEASFSGKSRPGGYTYRRVCYRTDKACQVMDLESNPGGGGLSSCPAGWTLQNSTYRYDDSGNGTPDNQYIQTNTCYICAP